MGSVRAAGLILPVLTFVALTQVQGAWASAGVPQSNAQWQSASPDAGKSLDIALRSVRAGIAERERALALAAQLEDLDHEELVIWERLIPALPIAVWASEARTHESALRLGALPLLAARQKEYRALELQLGRDLAAASSAESDLAANGMQIARLASIREWSGLTEQAQRQIRTTLDMTHALVLARASRAGVRLDGSALATLGTIRQQRGGVEAARAQATTAWEVSLDAPRLEQSYHDLEVAAALAKAAVDNARRGEELEQRAAADATPPAMRGLLLGAAGALRASARMAEASAAARAGFIDGQGESFLAEPRTVDAADTELTALLADRRGLARALRASLAARAATLTELKSMAQQREGVLAGAAYLAPSEDQRRAYAAVQRASADVWRQVDELRLAAGDIVGAETGERALATEWLGGKLEDLVVLEQQLHTLAIGRLFDPTPRPADPRLAGAASAWKRDADALQAIDNQWTRWRTGWDERGRREEDVFVALRALVARAHGLWAARIAILEKALPQSPVATADDISRLTAGMVGNAGTHARSLSGVEGSLRQLSDASEADPVVGAVLKSAREFRWRQASAGLRELPRLFDQVARLRSAGNLVHAALNPVQPATQRLAAMMSLSESLDVPWLASDHGPDPQMSTEWNGETFLLEGVGGSSPALRRRREFLVGRPVQLAALSVAGLALAQSGALPNQTVELDRRAFSREPILDPIPISPRTLTMIAYHTSREVFDNRYVYLSMPVMTAAGGAAIGALGGPMGSGVGFTGGLALGTVAVAPAVAMDALPGGAKGLIKGLAADFRRALPDDYRGQQLDSTLGWLERNIEDVVDGVKAYVALSSFYKTVSNTNVPMSGVIVKSERVYQRSIAEGQKVLDEYRSMLGQATAQLMRDQTLSALERRGLANIIRVAQSRADATRTLVDDLTRKSVLVSAAQWWYGNAAEVLGQVNDVMGPEMGYAAFVRDLFLGAVSSLAAQAWEAAPGTPAGSGPSSVVQGLAGSAIDPQRDLALNGNVMSAQRRSTETPQTSIGAATRRDQPSSAQALREQLERDKRELDQLRPPKDRDKDKDKKGEDETTAQDGVKTPVKPVKPPEDPDPTKTDSAGAEKTGWWGFDAVIAFKFKGASCTQTLSGEVFGTRVDAEQALRDETAKAMRADAANRSEVVPLRQGIYAGPSQTRPTYTGPTGSRAVQCASAPATTPTTPPNVPAGKYEPKGSGQPCSDLWQKTLSQCEVMALECKTRNCAAPGYSGCALDCPGCGGSFGDYVAWCPLHPSYESKLSAGLTIFMSEIKACINQFLADGKPGRRERGFECQGKAQKKLAEKKDTWVQQACQARCAQDGRQGEATLGGGRHRCECR